MENSNEYFAFFMCFVKLWLRPKFCWKHFKLIEQFVMTSLKDAQFNRVQDMLLEQEKLQAFFFFLKKIAMLRTYLWLYMFQC